MTLGVLPHRSRVLVCAFLHKALLDKIPGSLTGASGGVTAKTMAMATSRTTPARHSPHTARLVIASGRQGTITASRGMAYTAGRCGPSIFAVRPQLLGGLCRFLFILFSFVISHWAHCTPPRTRYRFTGRASQPCRAAGLYLMPRIRAPRPTAQPRCASCWRSRHRFFAGGVTWKSPRRHNEHLFFRLCQPVRRPGRIGRRSC